MGLGGQILILTSFCLIMPLAQVSRRHALLGGITAGILWEIMRHLLVWYFSTLSLVSVVYGSLGTAIVPLLSLEIARMTLLLGPKIIAEYERVGLEQRLEGIRGLDRPAVQAPRQRRGRAGAQCVSVLASRIHRARTSRFRSLAAPKLLLANRSHGRRARADTRTRGRIGA